MLKIKTKKKPFIAVNPVIKKKPLGALIYLLA